jgi:PKD repeat protein
MLNKLLFLLSFIFLATPYFQAQRVFDPQNSREGENVEYCHQHTILNEMLKDPVFKKQYDKDQAQLKLDRATFIASKAKGDITAKAAIFRIPVVFHLLHNEGDEKISTAQIMDALSILNRDYNLQNADANNVYTPWQGLPADIQIEFVLATKAPNGVCFSGITYTVNAITSDGSSGNDQVNAIKAGNDVYNGEWAGNKYLNIFICKEIGGAAGYTYLPGSQGTQMRNGIWVLSNYVGSIGTGTIGRSRTLTHEVGHWLGLPHVWGGTNNPGIASNCSTGSDDGVSDTPQTIGNQSCNLLANTCSIDNSYWGFDQVDNVENYMDYSYCSKMFTVGQGQLMQGTCWSGVGGRSNVVSASNLAAVGADSNLVICKSDFTADQTEICVGSTINFTDASYHDIQGWNWTFTGGTPSTSTAQNPSVTYNTPGVYPVSLTATDAGSNSMTGTKTGFVTVLPSGILLPYLEGFETYTNLTASSSFWRASSTVGNEFEVFTGAGSEGTKSIRLRNYGQPVGELDELKSDNYDLSGFTTSDVVSFSFKYAYRKRNAANFEYLRVSASKDCGQSWSVRKTLSGNLLSDQVVTSEWTPTVSDFIQVHVTGVNTSYFTPNVQLKFGFTSDGGNNLYLDQINFYSGAPGSVGLEEMKIDNLALYPNPTENELNLRFDIAESSAVVLTVQDMTGKTIKTFNVNAATGENLVMMETADLAAGAYFLNVTTGSTKRTLQFMVR